MAHDAPLTAALLASKARAIFGEAEGRAALDELARLRPGCGPDEVLRIQFAVLKLCDEDGVDSLVRYLDAARADYRDVLWWAEYPNEARLGAAERARADLVRIARVEDRRQYLAWLAG